MSDLDDILDDIAGRNEALFELQSAPENGRAAFVWTHEGYSILVKLGSVEGHLYADVSCWDNGERVGLTVTDALDTALVQMNKEKV